MATMLLKSTGFCLLDIPSHGIDWNRALGVPLFILERKYRSKMWWYAAKAFGHFLLHRLPVLPDREKWDFVFFKSIFRPDYDKLFADVVECAPGKVLVYHARYKWGFNGRGLRLLVRSAPVLARLSTQLNWRMFASIYCFFNYLRCMQAIDHFRDLETKVFVSFGDMQPLDNALIQFLNKHRRTGTATLQHGLYIDSSGDPQQINSLNFANVVARHFLAWGESTAALVRRHSETMVSVVGKPSPIFERSTIHQPGVAKFLVALDSAVFAAENARLIEIADQLQRECGLEYRIRLHPDIPRHLYPESKFQQSGDRFQFVLGHTTTLLIEFAIAGVPVFRLKTDTPYHPGLDAVEFRTAAEIRDKIAKTASNPASVSHLIRFAGSESKEQYSNRFRSLLLSPA